MAAWKTTAAKQHRICRSLCFLQIPHCNAETISLPFSIYSWDCSPWQNPSKGQALSMWVYRGKGRFFSFLFFFFFFQIVWKICLYLNGSLTCQTESGDCQNRGVQCCKKKKGKQYNKPESTFLNEWQFCLWLLRKSRPIYSIFISPGECWEWSLHSTRQSPQ